MHQWASRLLEERTVIRHAPISFVTAVVVVGGAIWLILSWSYDSRLASKDAQIASRDGQIALLTRQRDDYRDKLGGASPDQAAQKIAALEKTIDELTINRWPPLTTREVPGVIAQLRNLQPLQVNVLCSLAACDDLAESFVRLFLEIGWKAARHSSYFSDGINTGIEVWSKAEDAQNLGTAIERGTGGRLKASFHKWEANTAPEEREISLVIGRKP
jgi:hypothetical protein